MEQDFQLVIVLCGETLVKLIRLPTPFSTATLSSELINQRTEEPEQGRQEAPGGLDPAADSH